MRALGPLLLSGLLGCASTLDEPRVCPQPGTCGTGQSCVLGRCRATEAPPSPADTTRHVLEPIDLAVVAAHGGGGGGDELPQSVTIGRGASGTVRILLRFAAKWRDDAEVASAFVVLTPIEGSTSATSAATIEMARILEPWRGASVTWGRQPRFGVPDVTVVTTPRPSIPLRIDVTSLVRKWQRRERDDNGIALLIDGNDAFGVTYSLGAGGPGPRLEAYVR